MRFLSITLVALMILTGSAHAFLYDIQMYTKQEITEMTDDQIMDAYLEAKIEERASSEFHEGAGFSNAKEYQLRKKLLRYIIYLRQEINTRELDVDPIEDWLN